VDGKWKLGDSELSVDQKYQMFTGKLTTGNVIAPITDGKLRGDEITFTAAGTKYTGKVTGSSMGGQKADGGEWRATR
jgi:hypothetical protein